MRAPVEPQVGGALAYEAPVAWRPQLAPPVRRALKHQRLMHYNRLVALVGVGWDLGLWVLLGGAGGGGFFYGG